MRVEVHAALLSPIPASPAKGGRGLELPLSAPSRADEGEGLPLPGRTGAGRFRGHMQPSEEGAGEFHRSNLRRGRTNQ